MNIRAIPNRLYNIATDLISEITGNQDRSVADVSNVFIFDNSNDFLPNPNSRNAPSEDKRVLPYR